MIVRIQGEGQFELADSRRAELERLDGEMFRAVQGGDDSGFSRALASVVEFIRATGVELPDERLVASDLILPASDTTIEEAKQLLTDEGLLKPVDA